VCLVRDYLKLCTSLSTSGCQKVKHHCHSAMLRPRTSAALVTGPMHTLQLNPDITLARSLTAKMKIKSKLVPTFT
jgi:hypothetical protein